MFEVSPWTTVSATWSRSITLDTPVPPDMTMPLTSVHLPLATAPSVAVRPYEDIPALLGDDVTFVARFGYSLSHTPRHVRLFGYLCTFHDCMYDASFSTFVFCLTIYCLDRLCYNASRSWSCPSLRPARKLARLAFPSNVPWSSRCRNLTAIPYARS